MSKAVITESKLTAIANAIREKTRGSTPLTPDQMVTEIDSIQVGSTDIDGCLEGSIQSLTSAATSLHKYALYECSGLTALELPRATILKIYAVGFCRSLVSVTLPAIVTLAFYVFSDCTSLRVVDLGPSIESIGGDCFYNTALRALAIRRTTSVPTLQSNDAFANSGILPTYGGKIMVPRDLVATYQVSTNWATWSSSIAALEDYTVDGTVTGALDPSKIPA